MEDDQIVGKLAAKIQEALEQSEDRSIRGLSQAIKASYEHARKIVRGEAIPTRRLIDDVALYLGLDASHLRSLADQDRLRKQFPDLPTGGTDLPPQLESIQRSWESLKPEQREDLAYLAKRWSQRNKKDQ